MSVSDSILPVKVCGITRVEDGLAAISAGAAALGFIFYPPSPRYVTPETAARLMEALPRDVPKVGVFVGAPAIEINSVAALCGLDWVQLHGGEPASLMTALERPAYRAFRLKEEADKQAVAISEDSLVLLDTFDPDHYGGTGRPFNWAWAHDLCQGRTVILAGGITPENAMRAVQSTAPAALDISSGVEQKPGIKDAAKLAAFFNVLREGKFFGPSPWSVNHVSGREIQRDA